MSEWQTGAAVTRSVGRGSRIGHRCRSTRRPGDAARHLAGRGHLHSLRASPSGARRRMILYGGYARGDGDVRDSPAPAASTKPWSTGARGVGERQSRRSARSSRRASFLAARHEQLQWFNDLCLKTTSGDIAADLLEARGRRGHLRRRSVTCATPTLVLHARGDEVVPDRGRAPARQRHSGRRVRRARLAQSHPARARAGVAAVLRRGAGVPGSPAQPAARFGVRGVVRARAPGAGADGRRLEQRRHRRAAAASARRPSAITRRTCSTSSACGRGRRRSSSHASATIPAERCGRRLEAVYLTVCGSPWAGKATRRGEVAERLKAAVC